MNSTELQPPLLLSAAEMKDFEFYLGAYSKVFRQEAIALAESDAFREAIDFVRSTPPWIRRVLTADDRTFLRDLNVRWEDDDD